MSMNRDEIIDYYDLTTEDVDRGVIAWWQDAGLAGKVDNHDRSHMAFAIHAIMAGRKMRVLNASALRMWLSYEIAHADAQVAKANRTDSELVIQTARNAAVRAQTLREVLERIASEHSES